MWTKLKIAVLLVGLGVAFFYTVTRVAAEPLPPIAVVNHTTRECGELWQGDECRTCGPAAGWEVLDGSCPPGYTTLDHEAPKDCSLYNSPYCCQTVNSEWSGCIGDPAYRPPGSFWVFLISAALFGAGLFAWAKKKAG